MFESVFLLHDQSKSYCFFWLARKPKNTVQVAAQRAGESYPDTYELEADAIRPATRATASFGMTLPEFFAAKQECSLPGQEDLPRESDCGRITFKLAIVEADPQILRAFAAPGEISRG
jgi:hypothetical protein